MLFLGTSLNNSCSVNVTCDCENGNTKQITPDLKEAIFAKEFEDYIINAVFVKNDDKNTKDDTIVPTSTSPNVIRNVTSTISQGCNNRSKVMIFNKQDVVMIFNKQDVVMIFSKQDVFLHGRQDKLLPVNSILVWKRQLNRYF